MLSCGIINMMAILSNENTGYYSELVNEKTYVVIYTSVFAIIIVSIALDNQLHSVLLSNTYCTLHT